MDPGAWLVELLAWAAFETWWRRNPTGRANPDRNHTDAAIYNFIQWGVPVWTWIDIRDEYERRRWAS